MKRFITCASYYGTGSSAVTDFVSEYEDVFNFTNEEFRFLQDPDGISDLEFNLTDCFNRHNSGHSLKRYKRLVDFYSGNLFGKKYAGFFGDKWKELYYRYIRSLTDFSYPGWWQYDLYDRGSFFYFRKRILNKLLHKTIWKNAPDRHLNTMKKEITYCSHPSKEKFLAMTRQYVYALFSSVISGDQEIIMVDQLVPPINVQRYLRYFYDNIQVVIVDRDPRDVFVLDKYVWKDGILPNDAETFCKWFRYTRSHRKTENLDTDQIKFIRFEDLIYRYDQTTDDLAAWLKLDRKKQVKPRSNFKPEISIRNTQVWKKYPESSLEVEMIEHKLREYLYAFPDKP